jgi:hypothetical protein
MYPSRSQYKHSVKNEMYPIAENGGYHFIPVIENNDIVLSSGGNSTVFKVKDKNDNEFALKLFTEEIQNRFKRFESISKFIINSNLPVFVNFEFIKKLIYVELSGQSEEDCYFPGLIMKWINAPTLDIKLKELIAKNKVNDINTIASNFKDLSIMLLTKYVGHGDLKASNILVDDKLNLYLIDYDGMYIPEFAGQKSFEFGTPSYQHINRTENDFNEKIDQFSILVIYTSLIALAKRPDLYKQFNDGDNLIFTKEDFQDPNSSVLFSTLLEDKSTYGLTYFIKQSVENDSIYIDNVIDLLNGIYPKPIIKYFKSDKELVFDTQKFSLSWESENGTSAAIEGYGNVELNGSLQLATVGQSYFKLKVSNQFGEASQDLSIIRFPTPIIESLKVPIPVFESILNLSPITIQSPNINVSINFEISKLSQMPVSFTKPNEELINAGPLFKKETSTWNSISKIFEELKIRLNKI